LEGSCYTVQHEKNCSCSWSDHKNCCLPRREHTRIHYLPPLVEKIVCTRTQELLHYHVEDRGHVEVGHLSLHRYIGSPREEVGEHMTSARVHFAHYLVAFSRDPLWEGNRMEAAHKQAHDDSIPDGILVDGHDIHGSARIRWHIHGQVVGVHIDHNHAVEERNARNCLVEEHTDHMQSSVVEHNDHSGNGHDEQVEVLEIDDILGLVHGALVEVPDHI